MMGVELSQISLLYYLSYTNAAGSFKKMVEAGEDCGQGLKIKVIIQSSVITNNDFEYRSTASVL